MNRTQNHRIWRRVLLATAALATVLGLSGASCRPAMEANIDQHYLPAVVQARDAAGVAAQCGAGIGTPAQVAAATAAAESAQVAAQQLRYLMEQLKDAYSERATATEMRLSADSSSDRWAASIAEHERLATLAVVERGQDHHLEALQGLEVPASYVLPNPQTPNEHPDMYPMSWAARSADREAQLSLQSIQSALDEASQDSHAQASELAQLRAWLEEARPIAAEVAATATVAMAHQYNNDHEDDIQLAVRKGYKVIELGHRATALAITIAMRGDRREIEREAGRYESLAIARYEALLAETGDAQRRAQDAANAAYRAATNCGIDTAPIVPGSPEWNSTFWQVSSP